MNAERQRRILVAIPTISHPERVKLEGILAYAHERKNPRWQVELDSPALFGAPANTTYGENTGVLALSRVYDPRVIRIAAGLAVLLSFCPKFAALISAMPVATMGGVSMVLYGMISAVGVRNVVENKVDFTSSRNVIIAALIMVLAIGITYSEAGAVRIGSVSLSGLAVAAIVGILLNAVLPGKDYEFGIDEQGDTSVNFKV